MSAARGWPAPPGRASSGWRAIVRCPGRPAARFETAPRTGGVLTLSELIRGPKIASSAGRSVSAASTATITATAAISPSVVTSGMPATASETSAIVTVPPAKNTAPPEVAAARAIDSSSSSPSPRPAEVARDDEEGVVDPDAEADHRRQRRGDRRDREDVAEQPDDREREHQPDDRVEDRQQHRDDRPERQREDHHRRDDPHELAALGGGLGDLLARAARPSRPAGRRPSPAPRHRLSPELRRSSVHPG